MDVATLGRNRRIAPEQRQIASDDAQPDVRSLSSGAILRIRSMARAEAKPSSYGQ
jgi:hypothetical protein